MTLEPALTVANPSVLERLKRLLYKRCEMSYKCDCYDNSSFTCEVDYKNRFYCGKYREYVMVERLMQKGAVF